MRLLLVLENKNVRELLSFQISSRFPITVKEVSSAEECVELLNKEEAEKVAEPVDLVLASYNGQETGLIRFLNEKTKLTPTIFLYDKTIPDTAPLKGILNLGFVEMQDLVNGTAKILDDFVAKAGAPIEASNFCPIRTNLLIRATPLRGDIYIRLSKDKFIKLFHEGADFEASDLKKYYEVKKVEYMYVRRSEAAEFAKKFTSELDVLLANPDLVDDAEADQVAEMTQEAVREFVKYAGFSPEVQDLAKKSVKVSLRVIGPNPSLSTLLARIKQGGGDYLSQHSNILAHVACCLAKEMEWGSESTFMKLALAAFMHDISVTEPEIAKINSLMELREKQGQFAEEHVKTYHLHPVHSADLVKSFQEIPADVDVIVSHHHERPNGTGFPRGLSHNYIAPLAAVFIVAHDMTQAILQKKASFNLQSFVEQVRGEYFQGNFRKVIGALENIKLS